MLWTHFSWCQKSIKIQFLILVPKPQKSPCPPLSACYVGVAEINNHKTPLQTPVKHHYKDQHDDSGVSSRAKFKILFGFPDAVEMCKRDRVPGNVWKRV